MSIDPHNLDHALPEGTRTSGASADSVQAPLVVLIVEDDPDTARLLERFVRLWGHTPVMVSTCEAARAAASSVRFDAALCDIQLPDGDGVELVEELRRYQPFPCLAVTAHAMPGEVERCRRGGISHVLPKPFDADALKAALAHTTSSS